MTNQTLKSKIDALWLDFHAGGISNPISVIEQISYLMFARLLDFSETRNEKRATRLKQTYEGIFPKDKQHLRWVFFSNKGGDEMFRIVRDELFPFLRSDIIKKTALGQFLQDANCLIPTANLMNKAVAAISDLPLEQGDHKGDLYEYLLSKLQTAGIAGQFRTPRHIIRAMVEMLDPKPTENICDPACGTAGFLVGTMDYLNEKYTSPGLVEVDSEGDKHYPGDLLEPYLAHLKNGMFNGFDFDSTMLRIAAMNLLLHGIESPAIRNQDTLISSFSDRYPKLANNYFDVVLANPPFKGTIDHENVDPNLKSKVKTKKTELLFLILILRLLKQGGRGAVIVPDGVLFGSSQAHLGVRQILVDENQLEAVISLPAGVFKPYAGVSTAILVFTKGGRTDDVWFYDVEGDGFSLDDRRAPQADKNDLPDLLVRWKKRDSKKESNRTNKHFFIPVKDIRTNKYDLSLNRYRETNYEEAAFEPSKIILNRMRELEIDILKDIDQLEEMLK